MKKTVIKIILGLFFVLIFAFAAFSSVMTNVTVQRWGVNQRHIAGNVVIYRGEAFLVIQGVPVGEAPSEYSGVWRRIANYSNPGRFRFDSSYVMGNIVRNYSNDVFVARQWVSGIEPNRNDISGPWLFLRNYAPISGPLDRLPPHPGPKGRETVLGIDSDGDGVRDDIQIAITEAIPDDPQRRAAAMFAALTRRRLLEAFLRDTTQTLEQLQEYFIGSAAMSKHWINNNVRESFSMARYQALQYNTRRRYDMGRKLDGIVAGGEGIMVFEDYPIEIQEKYNRMFQEVLDRETERQK